MDLPDLPAAHQEALLSAREILADQLRAGKPLDGQLIEIADESGRVLGVLSFKDALRPDVTIN